MKGKQKNKEAIQAPKSTVCEHLSHTAKCMDVFILQNIKPSDICFKKKIR